MDTDKIVHKKIEQQSLTRLLSRAKHSFSEVMHNLASCKAIPHTAQQTAHFRAILGLMQMGVFNTR